MRPARLTDCSITDNVAEGGGGLYVYPGIEGAVVSGSALTGNRADQGGAAWVHHDDGEPEGTDLTLEDTEVSGNEASTTGSALEMDLRTVIISGGAVISNSGDGNGAAVSMVAGGLLESHDVDWGEGAEDNPDGDVETSEGTYSYGAGATFTCDDVGCR